MVGKVTPNTMLSASRVPALLGHSKYETPNDVLKNVLNALQDVVEPFKENEAMHWGNALEIPILLEASGRLGLSNVKLDHPKPYFHQDAPIACSLDGDGNGNGLVVTTNPDAGVYVIGQDSITLDGIGVLEAKLTSSYPENCPAMSRGPLQLQAQMDIVGAKWGAVCVLYQGIELRIFLFAPHEETQALIRKKAFEFESKITHWTETEEIEWYDPATPEEYGTKWPGDPNLDSVDLGDWGATLAERIVKAKQEIKVLEASIEDCETELKEMLGNATTAHAEEFRISWPIRNYQAQPEKVVPAKPAHSMRQSTVTIKGPK